MMSHPNHKENPMDVIALDIGRSAVKIAAPGVKMLFPTAVCPAVDLSKLEVGDSAEAAKRDIVEIDGTRYFIGDTAVRQSRDKTSEGLRDDWIESPQHRALLKGAYAAAKRQSGADDGLLVLGLPSRLFAEQAKRLAEIASLTLHLPITNVKVVPQAFGAYMALMLDESASVSAKRNPAQETWGVIDVGYYTTDFALLDGGEWSAFAADSVGGTHRAAENLMSIVSDVHMKLPEAEEALRRKSIKHFGRIIPLDKEVEAVSARLADEIIGAAAQAFGDHLSRLDGILVAGGGAELVASHIRHKWPHAETVSDPRYAVAEGMRRYFVAKTKMDQPQ